MHSFRKFAGRCVSAIMLSLISLSAAHARPFDPDSFVEILAAHLEGRLDDNADSDYNKVLKAILPRDNSTYRFERYPPRRALRTFSELPKSCIFPASRASVEVFIGDQPMDMVESLAIDRVTAHLATRQDRPFIRNFKDLEGKRIAAQGGVEAAAFIPPGIQYQVTTTPNDASTLKMLNAGRIDAMYGFFPDIMLIAERNGLEPPHFEPDFILFETTTHMVCKNFDGLDALMSKVNARIRAVKASGELKELLSEHARIVYD